MESKSLTRGPKLSCSSSMEQLSQPKFYSVLRKCLLTILLLIGAVLLEIRLIYAVCASVIVNLFFQWFGLEWHVVWKTLPRDLRAAQRLIALKFAMWKFAKSRSTISDMFSRTAAKHPGKAAFVYEKTTWTYRDVESYSNKVANFFISHSDLVSGDTVALLSASRPEYVCCWLGFSKIGLIGSLINCQLRSDALLHSLKACNAKAVIVAEELYESLSEIRSQIDGIVIYVLRETGAADQLSSGRRIDLNVALRDVSDDPLPLHLRRKRRCDRLFYIYTSGTTGLPKAAIITHNRFFYLACGIRKMGVLKDSDVLYCTLPLYHSAGGILGVGQALIGSTTVVIRKKFSASQFWNDCITYKCTVAQYIGEICRYLLVQKPSPSDKEHHIRIIFGNGMRGQIWDEFQRRFNIPQVVEFYGATEGNASLINIDNKIGAVGFVSRILPWVYPVKLIRIDEETGEAIRDENGICIRCKPGEVGELVGKIATAGVHKFDGYANQEATKKKIAYDVFKKGDMGFLTGDIMEMDDCGYMYFKDRMGDTYRWRGENVSTSEVEEIIGSVVGLEAVVVFGVEIPGCEGRAGMACIAVAGDPERFNVSFLNKGLKSKLPSYARPIFIRLLSHIEETGTFKLVKSRLKSDSYDPRKVNGDVLFYLDPTSDEYLPMTESVYSAILCNRVRY